MNQKKIASHKRSFEFQLTDSSWEAAKETTDWLKESRRSSGRKLRAKPLGAERDTLRPEGGLSRRDGDKQGGNGEAEARLSVFNGTKVQLGLRLLIENIFSVTNFPSSKLS